MVEKTLVFDKKLIEEIIVGVLAKIPLIDFSKKQTISFNENNEIKVEFSLKPEALSVYNIAFDAQSTIYYELVSCLNSKNFTINVSII